MCMRRVAAIIFALFALSWSAAPLLACLVPERAMSPQERQCCKHMADMCGSAKMPTSHSCCKTEVRSDINVVFKADSHRAPTLNVLALVPLTTSPEPNETLGLSKIHHPPGEFAPETTVLRI